MRDVVITGVTQLEDEKSMYKAIFPYFGIEDHRRRAAIMCRSLCVSTLNLPAADRKIEVIFLHRKVQRTHAVSHGPLPPITKGLASIRSPSAK